MLQKLSGFGRRESRQTHNFVGSAVRAVLVLHSVKGSVPKALVHGNVCMLRAWQMGAPQKVQM